MKKWLLIWIYRQLVKSVKASGKRPVGIPLERDPDAPCEFYEPVKRFGQYRFNDCETDGHYLCDKCIHNVKNNNF